MTALPDPRLAELQKLEQAMRYHFPGGGTMTPEQLKAVEGYFKCSDPGGVWT